VIFLGDLVGYSGIPQKVFGVLAILGQQEPGVPLMDSFVFVFESVSDEFDGDVSLVLAGVFHPYPLSSGGALIKCACPAT